MNCRDIFDKINLKTNDYVANVLVNPDLIQGMLQSAKGVVGVDDDRQLSNIKRQFKNLKTVNFFDERPDSNAFDKVVCVYRESFFSANMERFMDLLYDITDNNGYVLIVGVPDGDKKKSNGVLRFQRNLFVDWVCSRNLSDRDYWIFENSDDSLRYDFLFRVKKK